MHRDVLDRECVCVCLLNGGLSGTPLNFFLSIIIEEGGVWIQVKV